MSDTLRQLKVLPKKEEAPTEIQNSTKQFIKFFYEDYQKEVKQLAEVDKRHKQKLLDLLQRTSNEYSEVIITYLQDEYSHWFELSTEDIEYIQGLQS